MILTVTCSHSLITKSFWALLKGVLALTKTTLGHSPVKVESFLLIFQFLTFFLLLPYLLLHVRDLSLQGTDHRLRKATCAFFEAKMRPENITSK